jgi:hypothetical protein
MLYVSPRHKLYIYSRWQDLITEISNLEIANELHSKDISSATVLFSAGGEVSKVKLESDFSTIQVLGLPLNAQPHTVVDFLKELGFTLEPSCIHLKPIGNTGSVGEVKVEDSMFADAVKRKFDDHTNKKGGHELSFKVLKRIARADGLANSLQMSTVTCTWYKPSRVAWLHYDEYELALKAEKVLKKKRPIMGRKIQCSAQEPTHPQQDTFSVQLGNLDVSTTEAQLEKLLHGDLEPDEVMLGPASHQLSDIEAGKLVEGLLRKYGDLEEFNLLSLPEGSKLKASATFMDRESAIEAVRSLNNTAVKKMRNSKLFLSHVISVKYNVLSSIYNAIIPALDILREEFWTARQVRLKSYVSEDLRRPFTTLRLYGDDLKDVAQSKIKLERVLKGAVVTKDKEPLWDAYFLTPLSLLLLNEVCESQGLYIYRDAPKSQLIMYGGTEESRNAAQEALCTQIQSIHMTFNIITLDPELLKKALQGGWRRIKNAFGEAALLNVCTTPKTIAIQGTLQDQLKAWALLNQDSDDTTEVIPAHGACPVCWEEAEEQIETPCGHTYCKACFQHQSSSGEIPVICQGDEGKCLHIFAIEELKNMLPFPAFEDLLNTSFQSHIRTHPTEFQYCPTPDCPQIYRLSPDGRIFLCSACLTSVCTTCNVIAHDGLSCEELKDLNFEGTKAFQKYMAQNDVRPCPKCKTNIEKSYGCNHMECAQCKTHICWGCMKVFETSHACYAHMRMDHEDIV